MRQASLIYYFVNSMRIEPLVVVTSSFLSPERLLVKLHDPEVVEEIME